MVWARTICTLGLSSEKVRYRLNQFSPTSGWLSTTIICPQLMSYSLTFACLTVLHVSDSVRMVAVIPGRSSGLSEPCLRLQVREHVVHLLSSTSASFSALNVHTSTLISLLLLPLECSLMFLSQSIERIMLFKLTMQGYSSQAPA